jgi:sugar phosphate isomerase/epimerase
MPLAAFPKCFLKAMISDKTMSVEQWIRRAASELDIDGLEFYTGFTPIGEVTQLRRLRSLVEAEGLSIPMMCASPDFTTPSDAERRRAIEEHQRVIDAAAELGCTYCRVLSGQRRPGLSRADGIAMTVASINELIPYARKRRIILNLENHYKDGSWTYPEFAQRTEVFLEVLAGIADSPWFGVNFDPSNAIIGGDDPLELLEAVKHRVVTMHASDRYLEGGTLEDLRRLEANPHSGYASILKHGVIGRGLNDFDRIFSILAGIGFTGWVSIEDGEDPVVGMQHLAESADFLRTAMAAKALA